jgi:hypothetical protein
MRSASHAVIVITGHPSRTIPRRRLLLRVAVRADHHRSLQFGAASEFLHSKCSAPGACASRPARSLSARRSGDSRASANEGRRPSYRLVARRGDADTLVRGGHCLDELHAVQRKLRGACRGLRPRSSSSGSSNPAAPDRTIPVEYLLACGADERKGTAGRTATRTDRRGYVESGRRPRVTGLATSSRRRRGPPKSGTRAGTMPPGAGSSGNCSRHQKGITSIGTTRYTTTPDGTTTSQNGGRRYPLTLVIHVHTEEVTGSIPVSPPHTNGLVRGSQRARRPGRWSSRKPLSE